MKKKLTACILMMVAVLVLSCTSASAATAGWVKSGGVYKWKQSDGKILKKAGLQKLGGYWYYLKSTGARRTGWYTVNGKKYFMSKSTDKVKQGIVYTGKKSISGKYYYFSGSKSTYGQMKTGVVKIDGKYYYFNAKDNGAMLQSKWKSGYYYNSKGIRLTDGLYTISKKQYYLDAAGKKITNKLGVKIGSSYYRIDASGVATKISKADGLAGIQLEKIGMESDAEKNLKKAFDWVTSSVRYRGMDIAVPEGKDPVDYLSTYGLTKGYGDCQVQAAVFCKLANVLGFKMEYVYAKVVDGVKNGEYIYNPHAWCELNVDGIAYFYDPNMYNHTNAKGNVIPTWKVVYGTPNSLMYTDSHEHKVEKAA